MFKKSFLFRKWTPHCVTFPTNLLSHTEVVKWCKLFPAYHILPQWQQHQHTTPKGKQANPQPKGCNRNVTSTTKSEVCRKPTQGTRVTTGKTERQRGKEILEGMAAQEKERMPGKANCLLLFLLLFTFPKLHKLSSKYLLTEWLVQGWLHPTSYPNNMQFNKEVSQSNTTHFDLVWVLALLFSATTHFRANTVFPFQRTCKQHFSQQSLTRCPIQSLFPNICSWISWQLEMFH